MDVGEPSRRHVATLFLAQEAMWHQLFWALRSAANGYWSMSCETLVGNLILLIRESDLVPACHLPVTLVGSGIYDAVCIRAGRSWVPDEQVLHFIEERYITNELYETRTVPRIAEIEDYETWTLEADWPNYYSRI